MEKLPQLMSVERGAPPPVRRSPPVADWIAEIATVEQVQEVINQLPVPNEETNGVEPSPTLQKPHPGEM